MSKTRKPAKKRETLTRDQLEALIVAKGVARDPERRGDFFRFAVHEAYHAIQFDLDEWSSDSIHDAITPSADMMMVRTEIEARACEWLVCEHFGIAYDLQKWAFYSFMEAMKTCGLKLPQTMPAMIREARESPGVSKAVALILRGDF